MQFAPLAEGGSVEIVSSNSDAEIERVRAKEKLEAELLEFTINFLRVLAGAGRPYYIGQHMVACLEAYEVYRTAHGHYPTVDVLQDILDAEKTSRERIERFADRDDDRAERKAEVEIGLRKASLRVIAAQMAGQTTVESTAQRLFTDNLRELEKLREERRKVAELELKRWREAQRQNTFVAKKRNTKKAAPRKKREERTNSQPAKPPRPSQD